MTEPDPAETHPLQRCHHRHCQTAATTLLPRTLLLRCNQAAASAAITAPSRHRSAATTATAKLLPPRCCRRPRQAATAALLPPPPPNCCKHAAAAAKRPPPSNCHAAAIAAAALPPSCCRHRHHRTEPPPQRCYRRGRQIAATATTLPPTTTAAALPLPLPMPPNCRHIHHAAKKKGHILERDSYSAERAFGQVKSVSEAGHGWTTSSTSLQRLHRRRRRMRRRSTRSQCCRLPSTQALERNNATIKMGGEESSARPLDGGMLGEACLMLAMNKSCLDDLTGGSRHNAPIIRRGEGCRIKTMTSSHAEGETTTSSHLTDNVVTSVQYFLCFSPKASHNRTFTFHLPQIVLAPTNWNTK